MAETTITYERLEDLHMAVRNPKLHATEAIIDSIRRHGFVGAVERDGRTGRLVAGHGRVVALMVMRTAGEATPSGVRTGEDDSWMVPVADGWASRNDLDAEHYIVAANHATRLAGYDQPLMAAILEDQSTIDPAAFEELRFTEEEMDDLIRFTTEQADPDAPVPTPTDDTTTDDAATDDTDDGDGDLPAEDSAPEDKRDVRCPECGHRFQAGDR